MSRWRRSLAGFASCVLGVTLLSALAPAAHAADPYVPPSGAVFNVPRSLDLTLERRLHTPIIGAIQHAKKGSTIRILTYSLDRHYVADALIAAKRRGVRVQIILNDHQYTGAMRRLRNVLGNDRKKNNFIYRCRTGCRSIQGAQHIKIYLFEKSGAAENTVMLGSANLTLNATHNQYNDLWVRNNNAQLHETFVTLFEQARKDREAQPLFWEKKIGDAFKLSVLPQPGYGPDNDVIMSYLNKVHCQGATGGTGNAGRTVVRVLVHVWNGKRGEYLAKKIRSLHANGCDVRVMYGYSGQLVRNVFKQGTARGYLPVHYTGYDTDKDLIVDLYTHQKELLISGNWGTDTSTRLVVTGSSNWSNSGMSGDEIIFGMWLDGAYAEYLANFNFIWNERSDLVGYIPYGGARLRALPGGELMLLAKTTAAEAAEARLKLDPSVWEAD